MHLSRFALLRLNAKKITQRNWRPIIIVFVHHLKENMDLIKFAEMLRNAGDQKSSKIVLASTHRNHIAPQADPLRPALMYRNPLHPSLDGNSVDAHVEQTKFSENALMFQTSYTFLNSKVQGLMKALKGE